MKWLVAFLFTQAIEVPIYLAAMRRLPLSWWQRAGVAFGASALTHPIVWFVIPRAWRAIGYPGGYWGMVAAAETFAVLAEAVYLRQTGLRRALAWALLANVASAGIGLALRRLYGWP